MKECCKNGSNKKPIQSSIKKWFTYLLYSVITFIVVGALLLQLFGEK